ERGRRRVRGAGLRPARQALPNRRPPGRREQRLWVELPHGALSEGERLLGHLAGALSAERFLMAREPTAPRRPWLFGRAARPDHQDLATVGAERVRRRAGPERGVPDHARKSEPEGGAGDGVRRWARCGAVAPPR